MILYFAVEPPHRWIILDRRDRPVDYGLAEAIDQIPVQARRIARRIGVVPGELVTTHTLRIPARSRAKAVAAVPYMLEESLASNVEDLEFRLLHWVRGGDSKVAVLSRDTVAGWQQRLRELPWRTDALVPDYLVLPRHTHGRCTVARDERGRIIVRVGDYDGLVINEQELELWWDAVGESKLPVAVNDPELARYLAERGGDMVSTWDIGGHFADWLQHGHQVPVDVDLFQHGPDSAEGRAAQGWIRAAVLMLGLALLVRVGVDGYDYLTLAAEERRLNREIEATLKDTFPDITRVVAPRTQMEQRLASLEGRGTGDGFLVMLSVVAEAVPAVESTVEEITYRDRSLLITCSTRDFEALDRLQEQLNLDGRVNVELVSSGSRDNSVSGRFRLALGAG